MTDITKPEPYKVIIAWLAVIAAVIFFAKNLGLIPTNSQPTAGQAITLAKIINAIAHLR